MAQAQLSVKCGCKSEFQDKQYGKGIRVASSTLKGEARCTGCGTDHRVFSGTLEVRRKSSGAQGRRTYFAYPPEGGWKGGPPEQNGWRG